MHKTLKEETALQPRSNLEEQAESFKKFQKEYNFKRPHESLKNRFPAEYYKKSKRNMKEKILPPYYPTSYEIGEVNDLGNLYFAGLRIFLSSALANENVGLEEISDRHVKIHFYQVSLGVIDMYTAKSLQYNNPKISL